MAKFRRIKRSPELQKKLTALRKGVQPEVQAGLWEAGDIIITEQERLAPVKSGDLVRSLERKLVRGRRSGNQAVQVSTGVFYAPFVEFGTVNAPASPFFFPGFRAARRRARTAINKGVRAAVIKAVK